jgi:hypothetical protein
MEKSENNYFTFGGKKNNERIVYYKDLPKEINSNLDASIKVRCVHLGSSFAIAALKGGYDPEKVSLNILVSKGLLKDSHL